MSTGSNITNKGKSIFLYRTYTPNASLSATEYLSPTKFKIGIDNETPNVTNTNLDYAVPINNGTVNDNGDNQLTGSSGGDNTTDNTSDYKEGAGVTDATAQNLIANGTNINKIWTITNLATLGTNITGTKPFALWLYIKNATTLAKMASTGNCLRIKLGSGVSDYYSKTWTSSDLVVGWNWITSNTTAVQDLTETGTVVGAIDTFIIKIITNNATDAFIAGDVVYDLLRTWTTSDLIKSYVSGHPSINHTLLEVTTRSYLTTLEANGFLVNGFSLFNEDTTPLMHSENTFGGESKSSTDEFIFIVVDKMI